MHTIRTVMGDFLLNHTELPAGTASLMINHAFPGDRLDDLQRLAPTTKQYYVLAQRIPQKTQAMAAWSEALLDAFKAVRNLSGLIFHSPFSTDPTFSRRRALSEGLS
ncbi:MULTISPECIES: hypothetical protein [Bradyrhizobium]|uniref:Uncharacterized protein n=2 Tax=Bradyrhizobium TaxID=374 RepID=A0ABY0PDU9_9BRAD|nr:MULTISPECIES: hypothetical protein [Bradyrhizobium]SDI17641.1 hypothetical protein SAMN05444163_2089 [Bradyrhizobium ottawaense]SED76462.1 hypothetical protein SAMN05444171_5082 [Bradyrhizobium lablabi]SHL72031.1 hypothetical protein SAMN05444321_3872 [Bradyrhizobium lablabi]